MNPVIIIAGPTAVGKTEITLELAKQLGVSRGSLRKAIAVLLSRSLLVQVHGRGTFVSPFVFEHSWAGRLVGVSEELMLAGIPFETRVLEQKLIQAPPKEAARLDILPGQEVIFLKRLRLVENDPLVLQESYFRADLYPEQDGARLLRVARRPRIELALLDPPPQLPQPFGPEGIPRPRIAAGRIFNPAMTL